MERDELGKQIYIASLLKGQFLLKSGENSDFYFDKYKFETEPNLLKNIAQQAAKFLPKETDLIAGPELGGIALATALSLETGLKSVFVRKEVKAYGTTKIIEGQDVNGKIVCIIEDIITSGSTTLETAQKLREAGATVNTVICAINRNPEVTTLALRNNGFKLYSLFTHEELKGLQNSGA